MASLADLQDALVNADKAGDVDAARQLADAIHSMRKVDSAKPEAAKAGGMINDIGRQVGLTARYGIEGLAGTAQLLTEPIRYATDRLFGQTGNTKPLGAVAADFADMIGLPKPQGANERTVGEAAKLMAGTGGLVKGASALASKAGPATQSVLSSLSVNPLQQVTAAAGSGLAGGASKEAGGGFWAQLGASALGGVAGGMAPSGASAIRDGFNALKREFGAGMSPQQLDAKISLVLQRSGVDYSSVPERVRQSFRAQMQSALEADKELDPAAVNRLLDFTRTGTTPTRGMVTQDPVQITREMNLAKIGANSSDDSLHGLPKIQNQNNAKLIANLNDLGASRGNANQAGELVTSSVLGRQAGLRGAEQSAWDAAKTMPGYKQPISAGVLSDINKALNEEGMMPYMSPQISKYMEAFQTGQPFTPQAYRNLQSMLSREVMKGGNEGAAAKLAAGILRNGELKPAGFVNDGNLPATSSMAGAMRAADGASTDAIDAVNRARQATARAYAYEDSSPLVRSVLSDGRTSDPVRIAQSYIIGGTSREAADVLRQVGPGGAEPIKLALLEHLKSKAVSGASDETAKFSQSAFNKALRDVGDEKLAMLFSPEELTALRANGRVAALMTSQPVGSAVNNSNSGALAVSKAYDALRNGIGMIPGAGPVTAGLLDITLGNPTKAVSGFMGQRRAMDIAPGLLAQQQGSLGRQLLLPGAAMGGLLAAPTVPGN